MRAQFSCWQPVNNHSVKQILRRLTQPQCGRKKSTWIKNESLWKVSWEKNSLSLLDVEECYGEDLTWISEHHGFKHLSSTHDPAKPNVPGFSFSQLELTFTLAANETKQQRVIRVSVFVQGFYRKLISWGMQSCAKLIGGSWHSCRRASEYVFTFMVYSVSATRLSIQTVHNLDYFSNSNIKKSSDVVGLWKPAEVICPDFNWIIKVTLKLKMKQVLVIQGLISLDVSTWKMKVPSVAVYLSVYLQTPQTVAGLFSYVSVKVSKKFQLFFLWRLNALIMSGI